MVTYGAAGLHLYDLAGLMGLQYGIYGELRLSMAAYGAAGLHLKNLLGPMGLQYCIYGRL